MHALTILKRCVEPLLVGIHRRRLAALLEAVPGVDYVQELYLSRDGSPQGERVPVPPDRGVVAGTLYVRLRSPESSGR